MEELKKLAEEISELVERRLKQLHEKIGDPLVYLKPEEFDKVIRSNKIVVVDFSASWCVPCKAYLPVFRRVARRLRTRGVLFAYLDTDEGSDIADKYHVDNIPTTIIFVDGHVADVIVGVTQEKKLEERIENILKEVERKESR